MTNHLQKLTEAWNDAITPKPFYAVDEWVESPDGIVLSSRTSGIPGPLRVKNICRAGIIGASVRIIRANSPFRMKINNDLFKGKNLT